MAVEKEILRRIFGFKNNTENNEYKWRIKIELRKILNEPTIKKIGAL